MSKPLFGLILGALLGAIDGLTAWFYPEVRHQLLSIIMWSSIKSLVAGLLIGIFALKVHSLTAGVWFGLAIGLFLAFLVALGGDESGNHFYLEIMIPGGIVGLILGLSTQKYRAGAQQVTG